MEWLTTSYEEFTEAMEILKKYHYLYEQVSVDDDIVDQFPQNGGETLWG